MGADLAYIGTHLINTLESRAPSGHRAMIIDAKAEDIVHTSAVTGVPSNFMKPGLVNAGYDLDALLNPGHVNFGEKLTPTGADSTRAWQDVWSAGQGVGGITNIPSCERLVNLMVCEYNESIDITQIL